MKKFYKFSITLIASILILVSVTFSQVSKQRNNSDVENDNNHCIPMSVFFKDSLVRAGKSGGMALTKQSCVENLAFHELNGAEFILKNNLDLITQKNQNYRWEDDNGVINLLPSKSIPKLLTVQIKELKITIKNNLVLVADTILNSPEVITAREKLNLREGMSFGGLMSPSSKRPPIEMTFHNKNVREILNEIVNKHGRGVWLYRESSYNGADTFTLEFVVR